MAVVAGMDHLSELLIAQLFEEDLQNLKYQDEAERIQLEEIMGGKSSLNPVTYASTTPDDAKYALELQMKDAVQTGDALYAQSLQMGDASLVAGMQYALKLAAMERNIALDNEFAKRLQEVDDSGSLETDTVQMQDAQNVLSKDVFDSILATDPNDKGKGKGKTAGIGTVVVERVMTNYFSETNPSPYPICDICFDPCLPTHSPLAACLSANSSDKLPFGLRVPCPEKHVYCISCLVAYLQSKLDPSGDGTGNREAAVFPIRCPGCPLNQWPEGIPDELAEKVLGDKGMVLWYHQKLLDSIPRYYCPNPRCSALVEVQEDPEDPQAICPVCTTTMCVPCRVTWHDGYDCEAYQALPPNERSPEDRLVLELAKAQNWRRCPSCSVIVELTVGCNHITCRCGTHFCFKCGSRWVNDRCSRIPSCDLWDEQMLLEERERQRERVLNNHNPVGGGGQVLPLLRQEQRAPVQYAPPEGFLARLAQQERARQEEHAVQLEHERQEQLAAQRAREMRETQELLAARMRQLQRFPAGGAVFNPARLPPVNHANIRDDTLDWMTDPDILCGRHWFTTNMLRELTCGYCNVQLNSLEDLKYHLSNVRRHPVYACCGRFFKRDVDFERHLQADTQKFGYHAYQTRKDGNAEDNSGW